MADLGNSTLRLSATARRWYKHEIVEIMMILDEFARKAPMSEGHNASKQIVGAYVALIEIALRVICTALNGMTVANYTEEIVAAKAKVLQTIALSSETFQLTVGLARNAEQHLRTYGRGGGGLQPNPQEPKRQRVGNERPDNKVSGNVVAALKSKDGKPLCLGFINNRCTRKEGTCRFAHEALPEGLNQDVLDWIQNQKGRKT